MTPAMGETLTALVGEINGNAGVRAVVLTGAGDRAFSAGSDVSVLDQYGTNWQLRNRVDYARAIWAIRKPVVSAIRGYAIGGGLEMALMSDIRVAGHSARFGAGEIKLGWHGGAGNTQLLPRLVGYGNALHLLLTGELFDAETALHWGLVQKLAADEVVFETAMTIAETIAANAPIAAEYTKHLVRIAMSTSLDVGLAYENDTFTYCFTTKDSAEGIDAFAAKRPPVFRGE
jgi:enoyl-CoA hydratase